MIQTTTYDTGVYSACNISEIVCNNFKNAKNAIFSFEK